VQLRLRRDVTRAVRTGHPWIYAEAVVPPPDALPAGSVVDVLDFSGRFLARGLWDPESPIAVRVFTLRADEALDAALIARRLGEAAAKRAPLLADGSTTACRLVHGEADRLPGIVCDRYDDTTVVRFDGAGPASLREAVASAVGDLPGIRRILERPFGRASSRSGALGPRTGGSADRRRVAAVGDESPARPARLLAGPPLDAPLVVRENGLSFEVDVLHGHKTGLYLDQRENRAWVRSLAKDRRTLDLFAYTGGFTVAAAAGGAPESLSIELSRPAVLAAARNLARNDIAAEPHRFLAGDAFAWLESPAAARRTFDLIVVDPPSFAPNRAAVPRALSAYRRVNAAALRLAAPRALVLTCSCSSHVDARRFGETVLAAAADARRSVRIVQDRVAPADHPVVRFFPEGDYLKAFLLEVR